MGRIGFHLAFPILSGEDGESEMEAYPPHPDCSLLLLTAPHCSLLIPTAPDCSPLLLLLTAPDCSPLLPTAPIPYTYIRPCSTAV